MRARTFSSVLAATVIGLAATGCGGSSDGSGTSTPNAATSAASTPSAAPSPAASASVTSSPSSSTPSPSSTAAGTDVVANPPTKSWQDALDAARQEFDGDVSKIELERQQGGGLEYKIELLSNDTEFAVEYDANSLKKLSAEREGLGNDAAKDQKKTFDLGSVISLDKAAAAARKQQDGTITKWKIEGKDTGAVHYEFDVLPQGAREDTEVQINAKDGSLIRDS